MIQVTARSPLRTISRTRSTTTSQATSPMPCHSFGSRLARKFTLVGRARGADVAWRGSGCGLGLEHDVVAERVETADEALGGAVLVDAVEVIGTEVGEGDG